MHQARVLASSLTEVGEPITALHSSPWVRCTQTLEPLADALGVHVDETEALGEVVNLGVHDGGDAWVTAAWLGGRAAGFFDELIEAHAGRRVVACSHGDVIPATVALLVGRDALDLTDVRCAKGGRWTLRFIGRRCVGAAYHDPPS